jgi:hypothetical protein
MPTGFNADERAKAREEGPVTIGGKTYHARKLTNRRLREIRAISRESQKEAKEIGKTSKEYQEAYDEAKVRKLSDDEARLEAEAAGASADAVDEANQESLVRQLPLLLVDDNMQPVDAEVIRQHLEEDLDTRDVGDLMTYLLGNPDADPTPAQG